MAACKESEHTIPPSSGCQTIGAFREIVAEFHRAGLPVLELRPKASVSDELFDGDVDFLADLEQWDRILLQLFSVCRKLGVSFEVSQLPLFKRRVELLAGRDRRIVLEFWPHAEMLVPAGVGDYAYSFLPYRTVAESLNRADTEEVTQPLILALIYITHLFYKRKSLDHPEVKFRIGFFVSAIDSLMSDPSGPPQEAKALLSRLAEKTIDIHEANREALRQLSILGLLPLRPVFANARRLCKIIFSPVRWRAKAVIPIIGPDGTGKTTIINRLINDKHQNNKLHAIRFKSLYRGKALYFLPYIIARWVHRHEQRNLVEERTSHFVLFVSLLVFAKQQIYSTRLSITYLMDRYFYDYTLANLRNRRRKTRKIVGFRQICWLFPRPRKIIVLHCTEETMQQRKRDLTAESALQLFEIYIEQISRRNIHMTLFCSTQGELTVTHAQIDKFLRKG